ncbi:MAG: Ger(x)C family spore germination protein [Bacillota bacterium]
MLVLFGALTGCWSRKEIEDLAIVSALGFDKVTVDGRDKCRVTIQVIRPGAVGSIEMGGGGAQAPVWTFSSIGETVHEAGRDLSTRSPRIPFPPHARVVILGERLVREDGLKKVMDLLMRFRDIRLRTYVLVSRGDALDALLAQPELERTLSQEIVRMINVTQKRVSKAYFADVREVAAAVAGPGRDPAMSLLEVFPLSPKDIKGEGIDTGGLKPGSPESKQTSVRLKGLAAFRGDKLVGFLGDRETRGFLYITGKARVGIITVRDPIHNERDTTFAMTGAKTIIEPAIEDGRVVFTVRIKARGNLSEHEGAGNIASMPALEKLEENISKEIRSMAMEAVRRAQEDFRSDIFGFGDVLHRKLPGEWKQISEQWPEVFPDAEVRISVETRIQSTGMIGKSLEIK